MEEKLNLIQKLAKIRAISEVAQKNKRGFNYSYADITQILAQVTAGMKKYGVSLIPSIVPQTSDISPVTITNAGVDKQGKAFEKKTTEMLYKADMVFKWVNDEDLSDFIEVPWFVTGSQSDPSQALGSGLTYCTRYFLTSYFQIAQPETDPDEYRSRQKAAEETEQREIAEKIIAELDKDVRGYLSENKTKAESVKKFFTGYVKNGNYLSVKDAPLAGTMLTKFKETFLKGE